MFRVQGVNSRVKEKDLVNSGLVYKKIGGNIEIIILVAPSNLWRGEMVLRLDGWSEEPFSWNARPGHMEKSRAARR